MTDSIINELLSRWEELCREGQMVPAQELCEELGYDTPQIVEELERRMSAVVASGRPKTVSSADATLQVGEGSDTCATMVMSPTVDEVIFSVAQYDYFKFLAKGGVGEVYAADDKDFGRDVALKFIQREQEQHPESKGQFLVEGEITARLEHPGIVPVYGFGYTSDGRPFHVMRLIRGTTLGDRIDTYHREASALNPSQRRVKFRELLTRFNSVCNTIAYAHNRGILHRDIKPDNVMLGKYGETLVVDWGFAHPVPRSDAARHSGEVTLTPGSGRIDDDELCYAKGIVGTPCYMSPEQAEGKEELTAATDIYSLGALLYRLLTGQTAIQGSHVGEILAKAKLGDFRAPREVNPDVSRPLEAICLNAMARQPADRYKTPLELAEDIDNWLADEKVGVYQETLPRRVARWTRRHRTTTQVVVASLVLLVCIASFMSLMLGQSYRDERTAHAEAMETSRQLEQLAARESKASMDTLRTTAYAVAQNVLNNLESRRGVLERLARDKQLVELVKRWNVARTGDDPQLKLELKKELREWLNKEFDSDLPVTLSDAPASADHDDQFGNWFVNDQIGTQIARASMDKNESGQLTVGQNYAWRSYFNGSNKDSTDYKQLIEKQLKEDGTQRLIEPLEHGPHLGAVYMADKFAVLKIPLSTPIRDPDTNSVIGVLGMATDIGRFPELQDLDVVLVDLREDNLNGQFRGLILQHPKLEEYYANRDVKGSNFEFPRFKDAAVLNVISGGDARAAPDQLGTGLIEGIRNPLTERDHRVAAYCPVQLSARWRTSGESASGPCWSVVVFKKSSSDAE